MAAPLVYSLITHIYLQSMPALGVGTLPSWPIVLITGVLMRLFLNSAPTALQAAVHISALPNGLSPY